MDKYWVGGTASWDATAGTKWALTDGGVGGQAVPGASDDVFFTAASGTVTVTLSGSVCRNLTFTGFTGTITSGSTSCQSSGNMTLVAGMTYTATGASWQFFGSTNVLTSAGKTLGAVIVGAGGTDGNLSLADALTSSSTITVNQGTFTTNNFNVTTTFLSSSNSNTRTINLGSSTVTLSGTGTAVNFGTSTGLTFNAGTSSVVLTNVSPSISVSGQTFYNVRWSSTAMTSASVANGSATFNNLTVTGPSAAGVSILQFVAPCTINGTLSTTGTAGNRRVWFRGNTYGIAQTLTINSAPSLTDADFRDIYVIGTAAPISGTRIGDLRGCRGITFDAPKTVYWNLAGAQNWSANGWSDTSTGTPSTDFFPLAQDIATFTNAGSVTGTISFDALITYTGSVDMSGRTSAMTISIGNSCFIYGDWKNGSGTTTTSNASLFFSGRNTQTITSAGKTFSCGVIIDSYGGTVELADALATASQTLTVTNGTFDTKNFTVSVSTLSSSNSNVRTINLGSSTFTMSNAASPISISTTTNLTFNSGTSTFNLSYLGSVTITAGGLTFYNINFTETSSGTHTINGANTFNNLTITAPSAAGLRQVIFAANQTINGTLTVAGATAVRRIFLRSDTLGTQRDLTVGTLVADDCDFRDIDILGAAAGSSPTRAGDCGGNTGITFPSPKTVYWNLAGTQNWSATAWATSSGGTPALNNFPLAQDTAFIVNTGSPTTLTFQLFNVGAVDMSGLTSAMSIDASTTPPTFHGNWAWSSSVTFASASTLPFTYSGRGISTYTSAGLNVPYGFTVNCFTGTLQLGSDFSHFQGSVTTVLASGTFDAVTYNLTTGLFSADFASVGSVLRMGSGTWTLAGTGGVWGISSNVTLYKGSANIVLSNTSTSARTFNGNGFSYNKLTIGGTTGTSTLTVTGNNQFTELASTKTVAHTIALGSTTQTFGAWTVSGTAGNVVTVTGTGTSHVIAGARVSGVDYLAMGTIGFAATSPGEFYAGANSTGSNATIIKTAAPAATTRYWRGGTGTWDATTTTNWSASSGGLGGASVPTSADAVVFDTMSNATAYTVTCTATQLRCAALTMAGPLSGNVTWAGSAPIAMHGDVSLAATGITRSYTGSITLSGSSTGRTFTTNGVTLASATTVNGVGCGWTLGSAWNTGSSVFTVTNGAFNFSTYTTVIGALVCSSSNSRTVDFGASTITTSQNPGISFGTTESARASLTVTAGTSQINCSAATDGITGNNQTFYNVTFTATSSGNITINGANTFNNLSFTGLTSAGVKAVSFADNQTINGTLTASAGTNATMRTFLRSNGSSLPRTLTCAAVSLTDADFQAITIAGAAAPASGTRLGDCKNNSGITFDAAKTVYWNLGVSADWGGSPGARWATSSGGTPAVNNFPLAQDTAVIESTSPPSGSTITVNAAYNIGTIDMSARTSDTMTLATGAQTPSIYGNWINGTGTTLSGTGIIFFSGFNTAQTITSAGITFTQPLSITVGASGSVTLQDALTVSNASSGITLNSGTLNANGYNVTFLSSASMQASSGTDVRTVAIGSGTWTTAVSGVATWNTSGTNVSITGTGTISMTGASSKTFTGGGKNYSGITLNQGGAGTLTITGNNTFKSINNTYSATGATTIALGTTTQTLTQPWTATGEAGRVLTVQGTSASSPGTLIFTGSGLGANVDYLTITGVRAYDLTDEWYAGANSTNNGSLGWYFAAGGVIAISASVSETSTASDAIAAFLTFLASTSETATATDTVDAPGSTYNPSLSESATATDAITRGLTLLAQVADAATVTDATSVQMVLSTNIAETATATDAVFGSFVFASVILESATATDTTQAAKIFVSAVDETATATDLTASLAQFLAQVAETSTITDVTLVAPSVFGSQVQEAVAALDLVSAFATFNVQFVDSATALDAVIGAYLWNLIDDNQNANWVTIATPQAPTWTSIDDSQNPNWQNVNNS
jgi:hypothetical protein